MTMAGGAETPNIAALPAIARLGADRKATVQHPRPCAGLRQQLLFKGNVNQVVIGDHSELSAKVVTKIGTTESAPPFARGYVETTVTFEIAQYRQPLGRADDRRDQISSVSAVVVQALPWSLGLDA